MLTVTRSKVHECLGVTLDFITESSFVFSQFFVIKKCWLSVPEALRVLHRIQKCTAPENMLKADRDADRLDDYNRIDVKFQLL